MKKQNNEATYEKQETNTRTYKRYIQHKSRTENTKSISNQASSEDLVASEFKEEELNSYSEAAPTNLLSI